MMTLNNNLEAMFNKLEEFATSKTVVGDPVNVNGVILIPLVDVSVGMGTAAGGKPENAEGGASGLGAKITPVAVVVVINETVQLVNVKNQESVNKLIDMVPGILSKFDLGSMFGKKKKDAEGGAE